MSTIDYHGPVVAFDLDDTLYREREFCRSGFRYLTDPSRHKVSSLDPYPSSEKLYELYTAMDRELTARRNPFVPYETFFKSLLPESGSEFDLFSHITDYRAHVPDFLPFAEGVEETLEYLQQAGIKMALITDGRSVTQRRKIQALRLERFFPDEMILISEETGHEKKDSKEMFATVVRHYPEASSFTYVGNNPLKDFYFPNLLGWMTVMVPYDEDNVPLLVDPPTPLHAPAKTIDHFNEIIKLLHI